MNNQSFLIDDREKTWTDMKNMELEVQLKIMSGPNASFAYKYNTENNIGNWPAAFPENIIFHTLWAKVEFEI